jgi:hypothetical protein
MYGIKRTADGGFSWELLTVRFETKEAATAYLVAQGWDRLAEMTYGEEGARVVAL